eukprot:CAMPEP_0185614510 /NCGR_PEP_ID=MMETSP0436-20130131/31950_1 /TAXON_ID=626734 ORGANISM="Favella taraikaensis, Strain Fe Narragansett Bay" /NCGR_SAMPLE_ID=MMETSP0436 /ASSEMBLY_ACC=CAM_ASM_000390 /LENGTH=46 /DNA_ID= /DNA_START= /DNA_END= /DNA_ORIENTATION=
METLQKPVVNLLELHEGLSTIMGSKHNAESNRLLTDDYLVLDGGEN